MYSDDHLEYWGNRFVTAGLAGMMAFEAFMRMPTGHKRLVLAQTRLVQDAVCAIDELQPEAELHGYPLARMRTQPGPRRQPWYVTIRNRLRRRRRH
ncbi:MAG TPA: hypothetical protein PKZ76_03470 [Xanthomonadaceae bacterium]|nr:hypothetical protein [Xanthomonadaceae bacterium]